MRMMSRVAMTVIGASLMAAPAWAADAAKKISVDLASKNEVPPNDSKGTGKADLTYDAATKVLTWSITTQGPTGDPIAAHLHGPADAGANAGVMVNFAAGGMKMPLAGQATLTEEQATAFTGGKTYINIHTPTNKGGEIRGQVKP